MTAAAAVMLRLVERQRPTCNGVFVHRATRRIFVPQSPRKSPMLPMTALLPKGLVDHPASSFEHGPGRLLVSIICLRRRAVCDNRRRRTTARQPPDHHHVAAHLASIATTLRGGRSGIVSPSMHQRIVSSYRAAATFGQAPSGRLDGMRAFVVSLVKCGRSERARLMSEMRRSADLQLFPQRANHRGHWRPSLRAWYIANLLDLSAF